MKGGRKMANMTPTAQKKAATEFAKRWKDRGYEKGESQQFWTDLLEHVYGIDNAAEYVTFEEQVKIDKANGFIDVMNDKAVMEVYGFWGKFNSESECVAALMQMYQKIVTEKEGK